MSLDLTKLIPLGNQLKAGPAGQTRSLIPDRWVYITDDSLSVVLALNYFLKVQKNMTIGDTIDISIVDDTTAEFPVLLHHGAYTVTVNHSGVIAITDSLVYSNLQADVNALKVDGIGETPAETLNITMADNTLEMNIAPLDKEINPYTHHKWLVDDATIQTLISADWVEGDVLTKRFAPDWDEHLYYEWTKNDALGIVTQIKPPDLNSDFATVPGFILTARDRVGPVWSPGGFGASATAYYIYAAPVDYGIGLATTGTYDIYIDDTRVLQGVTENAGVISVPTGTHEVRATARDKAGNTTESNIVTLEVVAGTPGTVGFIVTEILPEEDVGTHEIGLFRSVSPAPSTDAIVYMSTIEDTAFEGTDAGGFNYYPKGWRTLAAGDLTSSGTTCTISNVGLAVAVGDLIAVKGAVETDYNGVFAVVTAVDEDTLTFTALSAPSASPATGTILVHNGVFKWTGSATGAQTRNLTIHDQSSTVNNQLFAVIDYDNRTTDLDIINEAMRIKPQGSGTSGYSGYQSISTSPYWAVIENENYHSKRNSISPGRTTDQWVVSGLNTRYSSYPFDVDNGGTKTNSISNSYGTNLLLDTEAPWVQYEFAINQEAWDEADSDANNRIFDLWMIGMKAADYQNDRRCHPTLVRPIKSIGINGSGGGSTTLVTLFDDHGYSSSDPIFLEGTGSHDNLDKTDTGGYIIGLTANPDEFTIPDQTLGIAESWTDPDFNVASIGDSTLLNFGVDKKPTGNSGSEWTDGDNGKRFVFINSPGTVMVRLYVQYTSFGLDKIVLVPHSATINLTATDFQFGYTSTDSKDDPFGPEQVTYSTGGTGISSDNDENTISLPYALPEGIYVLPEADKFPADNGSGLATSITIKAVFPGMSNLQVNKFQLLTSNDEVVDCRTNLTTNSIELIPLSQLAEFASYSVVLIGRVTLIDGITKRQIDATTWGFSTIDPEDTNTLFYLDFEGIRP